MIRRSERGHGAPDLLTIVAALALLGWPIAVLVASGLTAWWWRASVPWYVTVAIGVAFVFVGLAVQRALLS